MAAGIELQHGIGVGLAHGSELVGRELQVLRQEQCCQAVRWAIDWYSRCCKRHHTRAATPSA